MFITAVCLIFLLKLKWPKKKSVYDLVLVLHLLLMKQTKQCNVVLRTRQQLFDTEIKSTQWITSALITSSSNGPRRRWTTGACSRPVYKLIFSLILEDAKKEKNPQRKRNHWGLAKKNNNTGKENSWLSLHVPNDDVICLSPKGIIFSIYRCRSRPRQKCLSSRCKLRQNN